ncbi:hypothetical protein A3B21_04880 [Candidatus Uhrbacteria bacterium RIFCSPLOWO2_01_FULL_47_24]|uniref:ECF transporter S component n=1 Tax=Candidatus Uhrbacteria bacterium RIFCSPLOWO2_01_FULL_47_24 TaxID=1802401 RepID=A0A1F7UUR4_9BACT|nr:MAG: hypothetical protein A2753_00505 [Candidatus Uhrbacteria bacterium RIFCSPHIGHO2_01_FULL_47_11]OGL69287.1 MAG: hypothetical protein A3D58_03265 [Candidatus Uhrbacteria bacterium RIFCSPHIGHO2_02_FULL_46_47]OGL76360.1 MAG: hypothetical protein A3F52_00565 [Candidatus Uhrbacteria bacterium RIFCSPHIGHO2_12_FULL_47_11]OGL82023.1 MAG: hypothetical protein A3B21_04880 [Candidatus Uhrbacteria bacterium RIFCSPLOWO2_01_FULL_47_24]OGL85417.1 MAG: hypothetical protein A3J03_05045 [Candidatus Uhrbact
MKYFHQFITKKNVLFITIFVILGFIALQIPVAQLAGSKVKFTIYDAFAPVAGSFIGSIPGAIAVFLMQFFNFLVHGAQIEDAGTVIRFFPLLFAVLYFAKKGKVNIIIPVLAIAAFIAHPIGRTVWYFSIFWLIPIAAHFFRDRFLLVRALGATFTAHAVGGALWIWVFALPAPVWNSLIPVVITERLLFALGISGSFILVNNLLGFLEKKHLLNIGFYIDQKYLAPILRR